MRNLEAAFEHHFLGGYEIEVVDVRTQPRAARELDLIALPALIGDLPPRLRLIVGDLSNADEILARLIQERKR